MVNPTKKEHREYTDGIPLEGTFVVDFCCPSRDVKLQGSEGVMYKFWNCPKCGSKWAQYYKKQPQRYWGNCGKSDLRIRLLFDRGR